MSDKEFLDGLQKIITEMFGPPKPKKSKSKSKID